jgi:hypothetical protein
MPAIIPIPAFTDNYIPIVRAGEPAGYAAAEARAGRPFAAAVNIFGALRERKNRL